jgi:hypothetical protein
MCPFDQQGGPAMPNVSQKTYIRYKFSGLQLIPLHLWNAESKRRGVVRQDGKRPLHDHWTTYQYGNAKVLAEAEKSGRNLGFRPDATHLVIDVDPRNDGIVGFDLLCAEIGLDPKQYPLVVTGSGGFHLYMTKPADLPIRDTVEGFSGVEFKSKGRQLVAAGSIHPNGNPYYFDDQHPRLEDGLPAAPEALLRLIVREQRSAGTGVGRGDYTQEQLAKALAPLDPTEFREHDKWLRLMMACHHATNGDGRHEFIEFSTLDPMYANDAEIIGRRWDSLHAQKDQGVTVATLNMILAEHDLGNLQARPTVADDEFEDDPEVPATDDDADIAKAKEELPDGVKSEGIYTEEGMGKLVELNLKYCAVLEGGKFRIFYKAKMPGDSFNREVWCRASAIDFEKLYSNVRITRDKEAAGLSKNAADTIELGKAWTTFSGRRQAEGIGFWPLKDYEGYINMWEGFAVEPSGKGSWSRLQEMMHDVLSDGNDRIFDYIMNWCAYLIQQPAKPAESCLVFRGGMGVGKGTLGNTLAKLIGRHAMAIQSPELITGRFNSHLQDTVFLFADEAVRPYDKVAESRLKALITEPFLTYEGKGRDVVSADNHLHIMMASNEQWVIPAGMDDRRFMVSDANTKWQRKTDKWIALRKELSEGGGYQRMMFDLRTRPLPQGWHPRQIPSTKALIDQKIRNMKPLWQFFFNACVEGILPFETIKDKPWESGPVRFFYYDFRDAFRQFCNENGIKLGSGKQNLYSIKREMCELFVTCRPDLRDIVPEERFTELKHQEDKRTPSVEIPCLAECRAEFERRLDSEVLQWGDSEFG